MNGSYPKGKEHRVAIQFKQSFLENTNKLVVVNPSEKIKVIFDKILSGDESVFELIDGYALSNWIHAADPQSNPFRQ